MSQPSEGKASSPVSARARPSPWGTAEAKRTYVSGALWILGILLALGSGSADAAGWLRIRLDPAGLVFLAAALIGGWNFFPKGLRSARTLKLDMNFLMTIAITGALLIGEPLEAAAIAFLFSLAELLEHSAVVRARDSVDLLVRLNPERASVLDPSGKERQVPTKDLTRGHIVRVRPGEKIPIDGTVLRGESAVNEANLTGESKPVPKAAGDAVYAATLNYDGFLEIEASTDASDTTLARIVRVVREAQTRRSPTEQFVKKFARYYTPIVTVLAALTMLIPPLIGLGTGLTWFVRGLTLLVIACPCALVIATPVTVVSGLTSAARHGVLIKGGEYLEALGGTCAMAFDKTGTLTFGRLTVTDVLPFGDLSAEEVLHLASVVETRSEHPIARAIVARADAAGASTAARSEPIVAEFTARPGRGVIAQVDGSEVIVGTTELFEQERWPNWNSQQTGRLDALESEGKTVVAVGRNGRLVGLIALADEIRPESALVLRSLRALGIHEQILLTGDHERVARAVGHRVGIDTVMASLLPEEKVEAMKELNTRHSGTAMLGDGVNDAPALTAATVGIAMGGAGSPATIETADVTLMADDLNMLPYAVRISRLARRLVRFNIVLALGLKILLAVGAVTGAVSLLVAVLVGDMGASLAVTLNAMRLANLRP
ncbi:MAG: cadmium-translocating P-type ATPase [marine benthic group bacterium]|nr:cadmium-translocating P-type ATPase [Gemmatimonadota bacterium]